MSTFNKHLMVAVIALFTLFVGFVREARAGVVESPSAVRCRNLPFIKNVTGMRARMVCEAKTAGLKELTQGQIRGLTARAKSSEDHLTIARYFMAKADGLDRTAAGYEAAAANLRNGPLVKNFTAPTAAARLEFAVQGFREEAKANRVKAAAHEEMAKTVVASLY